MYLTLHTVACRSWGMRRTKTFTSQLQHTEACTSPNHLPTATPLAAKPHPRLQQRLAHHATCAYVLLLLSLNAKNSNAITTTMATTTAMACTLKQGHCVREGSGGGGAVGGRGGACCAQRCRQLMMWGGAGAMGRQQLGQATAHVMTHMGLLHAGQEMAPATSAKAAMAERQLQQHE